MATAFPEYVTDGHHIYLWHPEYESMFNQGKLKASDPPPKKEAPPLTEAEEKELAALRERALREAQLVVKQHGHRPAGQPVNPTAMEDIFGVEPADAAKG